MDGATSFSARRPATSTLPAFTLPPPTSAEIPSMSSHHPYALPLPRGSGEPSGPPRAQGQAPRGPLQHPPCPQNDAPPPLLHSRHDLPVDGIPSSAPSPLTGDAGASEILSPSLSSVNSGSSQGSQAPSTMYGYSHGSWPTPGSASYTVSSAHMPPALANQHYTERSSAMYNPSPSLHYSHPRSSQSPATGEGLPPPPYGVHQPFQTSVGSGGSGGGSQGTPTSLSSTPQPPPSILSSHNPISTQPPNPSSSTAHVDAYAHTRPSGASNYYPSSSTPQQSTFAAYAHPSPTQHSPTGSGRLGSLSGGHSMAPPGPYRHSYAYPSPLPGMGQTILSNIHQPNNQMSMVPAMGVSQYSPHALMYNHAPQAATSERPFKCDQCTQSFSRNHDLKRHKRIHLAVKPFPCNFCSKSFSRKDALKRHRLVKGCEGKSDNNRTTDGNGSDRNGDGDDGSDIKREI